jgi:hypothetical protein
MQFTPFVHAFYAFESPCFTIIIIMKAMSQSSFLPWELVKVILWEGHYLN